jgi:hypothetical protein
MEEPPKLKLVDAELLREQQCLLEMLDRGLTSLQAGHSMGKRRFGG